MPETVLCTICFSDYYGAQRNVASTARSLDPSRYRTVVAAPHGDHFFRALQQAGADTVELPFRNLFDSRTTLGIAAAARRHRASLIHAHLGISTLLSLAASRLAGGIPVIATRHFVTDRYSTISSPLIYNAYRNMYKAMNRGLRKIIFVSEAARNSVAAREGPFAGRDTVIPNGVPIDGIPRRDRQSPAELRQIRSSLGIPPDRFSVVSLSRLAPEKDLHTLLRAAAILEKKNGGFFFTIAGEGPMRDDLTRAAGDLHLRHCVNFTGFVLDKEPLLRSADAGVLCSSIDSFGISVLETMAAGVPTISALGGGPLEIISDNINGLFFPPGDAQALASLLLRLRDDPPLAARLADAGATRAQDFDERKVTARLMDLYDEVLGVK